MNEPVSKLSIRLKIQDPDDIPDPVYQEEVVYRWDRIIGAMVGAVVILGLIVGSGWYWLQKPAPTTPETTSTTSLTVTETPEDTPPFDAAPLLEVAPLLSEEPVFQEQTAMAAKEEELPTTLLPTEKPAEASPPSDKVTPFTETAVVDTQPSPARVEILSDHLVRAQLTSNVVNQEPVDQAPALMPMNEEGLIRVWFFTEMAGLEGQTVYHDWYLEDERTARVTIRPHLDAMVASSSKFIDRHMLGNWLVIVHTAEGKPLARAEFEVR